MRDYRYTVGDYVKRQINKILNSSNESAVRTQLAHLRRGAGKKVGEIPETWGITLINIPEEWLSKDGKPTPQEIAIHTALTYFALHQQGKDIKVKPMHKDNIGFGDALNRLNIGEELISPIKRRFDAISTSNNVEELSYHLRGIIQLLKTEEIALDYGRLAEDILSFYYSQSRDFVRLKWGEQFYKIINNEDIKEN